MVEISQRMSMTSRAAARFSTMEDIVGKLVVGWFSLTRYGKGIRPGSERDILRRTKSLKHRVDDLEKIGGGSSLGVY